MGFFDRLFGHKTEQPAQPAQEQSTNPGSTTSTQIPDERVGLNGEYDQSGLAKRVAKAFDDDSSLQDHGHLFIAQHNRTVVLKGKIGNKSELDKMIAIARATKGADAVETNEVTIGS